MREGVTRTRVHITKRISSEARNSISEIAKENPWASNLLD